MITLLEQNPIFRSILDQVNIGIYFIDESGRFSFVNKYILDILGCPEDELIGTDPLDIIHPDERQRIRGEMSKRLSGKDVKSSYTTKVLNNKGKTFDIALDVASISDDKMQIIGIIGFVRDISQQLLSRRERIRFEQQALLIEKLAALGRIATTVVHQINNPLEAIKNYIYLVKDELILNKETRDMFQRMENEVFRIAKLTRQIVDFALPRTTEFINYNINNLLEEILFLMGREIKSSNVTLKTNFDSSLPVVKILPDQLKQALINIVFNALEAMPDGGQLHVTTESVDNSVEICVSDTGTGIAKDNFSKIFDPFFSTKDEHKFMGLGLSVSLHVIHGHEGHIRVESEVDRGTSIIVSLPAADLVSRQIG